VVDDEPLIGKSVQRMFAREHEVLAFTDPREALARLLAGERFDLILCDVMMPELSGMDLLRELDRRRPGASESLVFITGGAVGGGTLEFLERCGHPHLLKPFEVEALREMLRQRLAERQAVRQPA
jgi:CheY-like chemotaxis protein